MAEIPVGAIPVDQFEAAQSAPQPQGPAPEGAIPVDQFESQEDAYGSAGQMVKAGAEGLARGILGPAAPAIENELFKVKKSDILGRQRENPITSGIGEVAGLTGSLVSGVGEGALLGRAGEAATQLAGLGDAAKFSQKVGSAAVQQAAEMAILQGSDETSKIILKDPDTSSQAAIANIGLAAALGGAGGVVMGGVVSPLWQATVGPKIESALQMFKTHVNGNGVLEMGQAAEDAAKNLGIDVDPLVRAGASTNPKAQQIFSDLRRTESKPVLDAVDKLRSDATQSVVNSLGIPLDEVAHYSENDAGHELTNTFSKEFSRKYGPVAKALEERDIKAATIPLSDESRLQQYNGLLEKGLTTFDAASPLYKEYQNWGNRILDAENIGGLDKLTSELSGDFRKAKVAGDGNTMKALGEIRSTLEDFKNSEITNNIVKEGGNAQEVIAQRLQANEGYKNFAKMSQELSSHLNTGEFKGYKTFLNKLTNDLSPEQVLNKFSPKGNADFIPFLQQHFPDTLENVRTNEMKKFLRTSVKMEDGESVLNVKNLNKAIENAQKGKAELVNFSLSPEAVQKAQNANTLLDSLPNPKNSGTAVGVKKLFEGVPSSAMAAVGWLHGHNPIASGILGKIAGDVGMKVPEAYKLAYLRFLSSDTPVKSEGFKAMVDFLHNSYHGQNVIAKGINNLFKTGTQVLANNQIPSTNDREKLDKIVTKMQEKPNQLANNTMDSHIGHYLPDHQVAISKASTQALSYLQNLKPKPYKDGPLGREVEPSRAAMNRYNRALDIAQAPGIVVQHIKDGTLQTTDIQDLKGMYPGLYQGMVQHISTQMNKAQSDEFAIPYKTQVGMSLFLGQPLNSSMQPQSIIAAQPMPKPQPDQQQGPPKLAKRGTATLSKTSSAYRTPSQTAERDRSDRD